MIKQLTLMFLAGVLVSLIVESHHLGLLYTNNQSFFYIIGYLIGYSLLLMMISLFLAAIPRIIYWAMKIKKPPKFFILGWTMWVLIIIALATNQLYNIATHPEPTSTNLSTENQNAAQNVYKLVSGSIYTIKSTDAKNKTITSGGAVAVSKDYLATNCHIIINPKNISVLINHEKKQAELYSAHNDLCIISIKGVSFTPVKMRRAKTVEIGEEVYAVGNPERIEKTISDGIISNKLDVRGLIILQTNASISHGSSG
ncbi:MAG TPA: serine protease, partial [Gammaproteobacteria bacterium]|nr:serine protease [Gammaproteobacteria bacterium]